MVLRWVWRSLLCGSAFLPLVLASAAAQAVPHPGEDLSEGAIAPALSPHSGATPSAPAKGDSALAAAEVLGAESAARAANSGAESAPSAPELAPEAAPVPSAPTLELSAPALSAPEVLPPVAGAEVSGGGATALLPLVSATADALPGAIASLAQVRPAPDGDGWEYVIEPYLFLPLNINATVNVAGVEQSISVGLGDLLNLDRAFAGGLRFEAHNPQYGFFGDLSYVYAREGRSLSNFPLPQVITDPLSLVSGVPLPPGTPASITTTASTSTTTLDLGGFYRVVDKPLGDGGSYPCLLVDPLAGLRLIFLSGSVDFTNIAVVGVPLGGRSLSRSATLVQPLLGVQASLELSDRWALGLRGDLAGFGLGADENLSWNLLLGSRYSFSDTLALQLAYRFTELRYRQGQGSDGFGLAQSQNGFWVGLDIEI